MIFQKTLTLENGCKMFQEFLNWYAIFAKENPIVASAFGVGLGGWALMMLKSTPRSIFNFIKSRVVTTLVMNNANNNGDNTVLFMAWFNEKSNWGHLSRNFAIEVESGDSSSLNYVSGFGLNFFVWRRHVFWFRKIKLESSGTYMEKFEITLSMLGRNQNILKDLVEQFRYRRDSSKLSIYQYQNGWHDEQVVRKRSKASVILRPEVSQQIFGRIEDFVDEKQWHYDRGLSYKICFMFTGPPGSGKTSLSKAIGSHFGRNVFTLSLAGMTDAKLQKAMASVPTGNIIQIEDFETSAATKSRGLKPLNTEEQTKLREYTGDFNVGISIDDLSYEIKQTMVNDGFDLSSIVIAEHKSIESTYFYWDRYVDEPKVSNVSETLSSREMIDVLRTAYDTIDHVATLYNRAQGASDTVSNGPGGLTLTGLLNALDGLIPLDDQIVILTTNHPEQLDAALVRKGRVDHIVELGLLGDSEVRRYIALMFPDHEVPIGIKFKEIAGCNLQAIFYEHKYTPSDFILAIPKE